MASVNKNKILRRLQEHWDYAVAQGINPDLIIGVFLYGSQNYGFGTDSSDVDSVIITVPTFQDFCLKPELISKNYQIPLHNGFENIDVKDVRLMRQMFMKQNINFLELLYTDYYILNPKYETLFKYYFINNREAIAHYDRERALKSISGQAIHTLHENATNNKNLYNADRLYIFLRDYLQGKSYEECLKPTGDEWVFLWELKNQQSTFSRDSEAKLDYSEKLLKMLRQFQDLYPHLDSPMHEEAQTALDNGTVELIRCSFAQLFESSTISKQTFLKSLTENEKKAYYFLIEHIHEEGNIIITQVVDESPFSRQVFTNVLKKMKEYHVAEIKSTGKRGTYIKITQPELKIEARNYKKGTTELK